MLLLFCFFFVRFWLIVCRVSYFSSFHIEIVECDDVRWSPHFIFYLVYLSVRACDYYYFDNLFRFFPRRLRPPSPPETHKHNTNTKPETLENFGSTQPTSTQNKDCTNKFDIEIDLFILFSLYRRLVCCNCCEWRGYYPFGMN